MTVGGGSGQAPKIEQAADMAEVEALSKLKELLGSTLNEELALKALRAARTSTGRYDCDFAANWIFDQNSSSPTPQPPSSPSSASTASTISTIGPKTAKEMESTKSQTDGRQKTVSSSEDTDLQKAIALSLSEQAKSTTHQQQTPLGLGGQISAEEQELSRVIEASIAESKKGAAHDLRQSALFFVDPPNPHERERLGIWPVGLKNIGNTCWFSVVIQALFHLPIFRRRLLNCDFEAAVQRAPEVAASSSTSSTTTTTPRELEFAAELRKLFALLLASRRKYVNPSGAVEVLRKQDSLQLRNIGGLDSGQQDVSEFTHLLLEWLEEAFKLVVPSHPAGVKRSPSSEAQEIDAAQKMEIDSPQRDNPIEQLFYGTFVRESTSNPPAASVGDSIENIHASSTSQSSDIQADHTTKEERFSQYPLQVVGCETLHDSMEKSLRPDDCPDIEQWLERLPPVFLFELTRFQYNQVDKKPEKIHSKFRFPKVLYVDRYLRENKISVREKRGHVGRLRQQLNALKYELEKLENYCGSKMPLSNVFGLALNFIGRGEDRSVSCESEPMDGCEPTEPAAPSVVLPRPVLRYPTDATEADLGRMEYLMHKWRTEALQNVEELKRQIMDVEEQIEQVYCEPRFQQHPYVLHAVLVHEGQATLGHYWTFIGDRKTENWRKFNDVQVTEVNFKEVERDSFGGYQSTSAYCLVYVDVRRSELFDDMGNVSEMQLVANLPADLQRFVSEDNVRFNVELNEWDRKHASTPTAPAASPTGATSAASRLVAPAAINETELASLIEEHGRLAVPEVKKVVIEFIKSLVPPMGSSMQVTSEALLNSMIEEHMANIKQEVDQFLSAIGYDSSNDATPNWQASKDIRTRKHIPFYAYCWIRCGGGKNLAPFDDTRILRRIVLDFFANPGLVGGPETNDRMTEIYQAAKRAVASFGILTSTELQVYSRIYYDFKLYLETIVLMTYSWEKMQAGSYLMALQGMVVTKYHAEKLAQQSLGAGGVDIGFIIDSLKLVAMHVSDQTVKEFLATNDDKEVEEKLKNLKVHLLPALIELYCERKDDGLLESIRACWLAAADEKHALQGVKLQAMQDFLNALSEVDAGKLENSSKQCMNAKVKLQPGVGITYFNKTLPIAREFGLPRSQHQ